VLPLLDLSTERFEDGSALLVKSDDDPTDEPAEEFELPKNRLPVLLLNALTPALLLLLPICLVALFTNEEEANRRASILFSLS